MSAIIGDRLYILLQTDLNIECIHPLLYDRNADHLSLEKIGLLIFNYCIVGLMQDVVASIPLTTIVK